jgi:hypothetical protein
MGGTTIDNSSRRRHLRHREEGLNSANRNGTTGVFKRFLGGALIVGAGVIGVPMGSMQQAKADESGMRVEEVQRARDNVETNLTKVKSSISTMEKGGMTPAAVPYTDRNVRGLLTALVQLNQKLRQHNGGNDVIPITGATDRDKFRSMNRWLGRSQDAPLDKAGVATLEQKVTAALGTPSADAGATTILAAVPTATQSTTAAVVPVHTTAAPKKAAPSAQSVAAAENAQLIENLEVVAAHGRTKAVRTNAQKALDRLQREINRDKGPRERTLGRYVAAGQKIVDRELPKSQTRATDSRMANVPGVASAQAHPLSAEVNAILTDLQAIAGDTSVSVENQNLANKLANSLADALLLGEDPAGRMVRLIGKARDVLKGNDEKTANKHLTAALRIFEQEQKFMRQRLDGFVVPVAQAALGAIDKSNLPTRAELATAAQSDSASKGTYDYIPVRDNKGKITRRVRTGREDVRQTMEERLAKARGMVQAAQSGGKLSHHAVTELYQSVTLEEKTMKAIIDLWQYASSQNIEKLPLAARTQLRRQYAFAVATLLDPDFIPYTLYSADTRRSMARVYLKSTGGRLTDSQVKKAEEELLPALMRSRDFRYEDVLHKLYLETMRLAPDAPASAKKAISTMATLRAMRPRMRSDYLPYVIGMRWEIDEGQRSPVILTEAELQSQERLDLARGFLEEAVRGSGRKSSDRLVKAANAWLKHAQSVKPEDIPRVSDTLYHMALGLASITEAKLWRANRPVRRDLSDKAKKRADYLIKRSEQMFTWCFSSPKVDAGYHPNLATNIADTAINYMAPRALQATESPAMLATLAAYDAPATQGIPLADPENPTAAESARAAQLAEERYLRFLASVKGDASFGVSAYHARDASSRRSFELLEPMVGRNPVVGRLGGYPILRKSSGRGRTTSMPVDQHVVPSGNTREADFSNNNQEDAALAHYGHVYAEVYRLTLLRGNDDTPELLRGIDPAPHRTRMLRTSNSYGAASASDQVEAGNAQLIAILDTRLKELRTRLNGKVKVASGREFRRRDLARSETPLVMYVKRAVEAERLLTAARAELHKGRRGDLFTRRYSPRLAIATAEVAIASLDDSILKKFPDPKGLTDDLKDFTFYVPRTAIDLERYSRGSSRRVRFTAQRVMVREKDGTTMTFEQFQRMFRKQHSRDVNLTHYWFVYQNLGRRDSSGKPILYLRNPQYDPRSNVEARRRAYVGQVMDDVVLSDGTRIGRAVVRVRPSGLSATEGPEWAPLVNTQGRVRSSDVLFKLEGNSLDPVRDTRLRRVLPTVCAPTDHNQYWTHERGESTPVIIVSPRSTSEVAKKK